MVVSVNDNNENSILDKIKKLLAKAEGTSNEQEAEAFAAKATELMFKYAISDEALHDGEDMQGVGYVEMTIPHLGKFWRQKANLANAIAKNNRCEAIYMQNVYPAKIRVYGYPSDRLFVEMLYTNLCIEMLAHMFEAQEKVTAKTGKSESFQNAFCAGFVERVGERLRQQKAQDMREAQEAGNSNLPVLRKREVEAREAMDSDFPKTGTLRRGSYEHTVGKGMGRQAGDRVGTGATQVGGQRALRR